jgi:rhamnogalacturonyl hydrolase YesR
MSGSAIVLLFALSLGRPLSAARQAGSTPFCEDCNASRQAYRQLCDYIVENKADFPVIFVGGYYMRTLVAGYEIFGERRYLETARAYGDWLLTRQMSNGFWGTGYGNIYLADTGSAIGLLIVLSKHVTPAKRAEYLQAVTRYADAVEKDGLIHPSGAFGTGFRATKDGAITGPYPDEYTISSALCGGEVFTWLYQQTRNEAYLRQAHHALRWILGTMREDGVIPYVLAGQNADLGKHGDAKNDYNLWQRNIYQASTYVGEGLIAFDTYCGNKAWRQQIRDALRPHVEFLLRTQNADGTWAQHDSYDQKRTPGVSNFLIWYYRTVSKDPRIAAAVRRFGAVLSDPAKARELGLHDYAAGGKAADSRTYRPNDVITSLAGRAMADMLLPGVDVRW